MMYSCTWLVQGQRVYICHIAVPWMRQRSTNLKSLFRPWNVTHQSTRLLHWLNESMDAGESPQTQCVGDSKTEFIRLGSALRRTACSFRPIVVSEGVDPAIDRPLFAIYWGYHRSNHQFSPSCHQAIVLSSLDFCNRLLGGALKTFLANSLVSWWLMYDLFWCSLGRTTWLTKFVRSCIGLLFIPEYISRSVSFWISKWTVLCPLLTWYFILCAHSKDVSILVWLLLAYCVFHVPSLKIGPRAFTLHSFCSSCLEQSLPVHLHSLLVAKNL